MGLAMCTAFASVAVLGSRGTQIQACLQMLALAALKPPMAQWATATILEDHLACVTYLPMSCCFDGLACCYLQRLQWLLHVRQANGGHHGAVDGLLDPSVVENMTNWAWLLHQVNGHHRSVDGLFDLLVDVTYWEMTN